MISKIILSVLKSKNPEVDSDKKMLRRNKSEKIAPRTIVYDENDYLSLFSDTKTKKKNKENTGELSEN